MRKKVSLIVAITLSTTATAQTSNTTCTGSGMFVNCTTQHTPAPDYSGFANLARAIREKKARKRAEKAAEADAAIRAGIMQLLKDGNCPGAKQAALDLGTLELATQVAQYCAADGQ